MRSGRSDSRSAAGPLRLGLARTVLPLGLLLVFTTCEPAQTPTSGGDIDLEAARQGRPSGARVIGINVLLNTAVTDEILADLGTYGRVRGVLYRINAVMFAAEERALPVIQALPYVAAANPDAEREARPLDTVELMDFTVGLNTWDQDAINVTDFGAGRVADFTGNGVYVGVLDTGLKDTWRQYFPQERIAEHLATSFGGGGADFGAISEQPNKWEHDRISHGTHVTSTILGYSLRGVPINGTAPEATVIPVKVLNNSGFGWSSVVAHGIVYIGELKEGPLAAFPVVINMSLGGSALDAVEKAAIDFAIAQGVIVVASAGNRGENGMSFPGAYAPVISAAASGWIGEWRTCPGSSNFRNWWRLCNVPDPIDPDDFYITSFSSRERSGQQLDIAAPGSWVVGPFQLQSGMISYFFLGGTSMASPHVAGTVALMLEKNPTLTASQAEAILKSTAVSLGAGTRTITRPSGATGEVSWDTDATGAGLLDAQAALAATP